MRNSSIRFLNSHGAGARAFAAGLFAAGFIAASSTAVVLSAIVLSAIVLSAAGLSAIASESTAQQATTAQQAAVAQQAPPTTTPVVAPATAPADFVEPFSLPWWKQQTAALGDGVLHDDVYTIAIPRPDLTPQTQGGEIPPAAGIESRIDFYRCTCGRPMVVGQVAAADYESDGVIDALRGGDIRIASMAPMFLDVDPMVLAIRFQGEGDLEVLSKTIKSALDSTGPTRLTTRRSAK
jgi:hypothetical protein